MNKTRILLLLLVLIIISTLLIGCNSNIKMLEDGIDYPVSLPRQAKDYLQNLGDMKYLGKTELDLEGTNDPQGLYVNNAEKYDEKKALMEWKTGGISSLLSNMIDDKKLLNDTIFDYSIKLPEILIDLKNYNVYSFNSDDAGLNLKTKKGCAVFIEKGTETADTPHMYIWSYYIISGIGSVGLLMPSDSKIYTNYLEIGGKEKG